MPTSPTQPPWACTGASSVRIAMLSCMAFDGTVDYSEEDGRSCDDDNDIDAKFLHVTAPPLDPEDGTAGWWIEEDVCLYLSAGDCGGRHRSVGREAGVGRLKHCSPVTGHGEADSFGTPTQDISKIAKVLI
ncbi:hypothetical protein PG985_006786 [Apiospora marii]|uniref:Uncharacterized protein n=1 Tax=Apiospora marii TaxID=335849 RepID=A0ABR1SIB2_9PEZI